jgi:hypothetical protein
VNHSPLEKTSEFFSPWQGMSNGAEQLYGCKERFFLERLCHHRVVGIDILSKPININIKDNLFTSASVVINKLYSHRTK